MAKKQTKNTEIRMEFIVHPSQEKQTPDNITRGIFGMGVEQLINEIILNADGKYDVAYGKGGRSE